MRRLLSLLRRRRRPRATAGPPARPASRYGSWRGVGQDSQFPASRDSMSGWAAIGGGPPPGPGQPPNRGLGHRGAEGHGGAQGHRGAGGGPPRQRSGPDGTRAGQAGRSARPVSGRPVGSGQPSGQAGLAGALPKRVGPSSGSQPMPGRQTPGRDQAAQTGQPLPKRQPGSSHGPATAAQPSRSSQPPQTPGIARAAIRDEPRASRAAGAHASSAPAAAERASASAVGANRAALSANRSADAAPDWTALPWYERARTNRAAAGHRHCGHLEPIVHRNWAAGEEPPAEIVQAVDRLAELPQL